MANSVGKIGCGGGGTPPFLRISSCESDGCVHPGLERTSPYRMSGLCESNKATAYVFLASLEAGSTCVSAYEASGSEPCWV